MYNIWREKILFKIRMLKIDVWFIPKPAIVDHGDAISVNIYLTFIDMYKCEETSVQLYSMIS